MALPLVPLAAGAVALFLLARSKSSPSSSYSQAPSDGSQPATKESAPPAKSWQEMPPALQEQVAAALGALGVSPATGELSGQPVTADAIKMATQTAALCESQGFYDVAKELRRLIGKAAPTVPSPPEVAPIAAAAPPGLTPEQATALARTLTLDRDPASIQAVIVTLQKLPPSPQRDNLISMAQALLLQLQAAQSTTQTMQQIDQVIKSPGIAEVHAAVQPLPPAVIPVITPPSTPTVAPSTSSPLPTALPIPVAPATVPASTGVPALPSPLPPPATSANTYAALLPLTGSAVLQSGSKGGTVSAWQHILGLDGFPVVVDGAFGPATLAATIAWQKQRGLTADGKVGAATRAKVGTPPLAPAAALPPVVLSYSALLPKTGTRTLTSGLSGPDVKAWQQILQLDGASLTADGSFGPATLAATKTWQSAHGLTADGKVGAGTRAKVGTPPVGRTPSTSVTPSAPSPVPAVIAPVTPSSSAPPLIFSKVVDPTPSAPALKKGSKGDAVKSWQNILTALGYGSTIGTPDGDFGAKTDTATRALQAYAQSHYIDSKPITVDGVVGAQARRIVVARTAELKGIVVAGRSAT
jgi:peptidoglycan hydrolase-like protein with peptidoglycan-binding domain